MRGGNWLGLSMFYLRTFLVVCNTSKCSTSGMDKTTEQEHSKQRTVASEAREVCSGHRKQPVPPYCLLLAVVLSNGSVHLQVYSQ